MACKGICLNLSGAVVYHDRKTYKIGNTGLKCDPCEIHLPIDHPQIKIGISGAKRCPCCGHRLSHRINNKKRYLDKLVKEGAVIGI